MPNKISRAPEYAFFRGFKTFGGVLDMSGDQYVRLVDVSQMDVGSASINFSGCTALEIVVADQLVDLGGISFSNCSTLEVISIKEFPKGSFGVANLESLQQVLIDESPNLSNLSIDSCEVFETISANDCPSLVSVNIVNCPSIIEVFLTGAALPESVVDAVLVALDESGSEEGSCDISGGTSAPPSATGLAAKASLEGKNWEVTVNT